MRETVSVRRKGKGARESEQERAQAEGGTEGEADSLLSRWSNEGLDPGTLGS